MLTLTVRGTPFLYYGEELGMGDVMVPPEESIDAPASRVTPDFLWWDRSRSRTPMPWSGDPRGGFSAGQPWLRLGPDVDERNVATQSADADSVLQVYCRLMAARAELPSIQDGTLEILRTTDPDVLGYRRIGSGPEVLVLIGFADRDHPVAVPRPRRGGGWRPVAGTHRDLPERLVHGASHTLRPYEGIVAVRG